jgi:hypothetical protein
MVLMFKEFIRDRRISSYIKKPSSYNFATDPIWIYLHVRKILFSFLSVCCLTFVCYPCVANLQDPVLRAGLVHRRESKQENFNYFRLSKKYLKILVSAYSSEE